MLFGGAAFAAVYYLQMPLQSAMAKPLLGSDIPMWLRNLIIVFPSGVIQEFFKMLVPMILLLVGLKLGTSKNLFGPFAGAGFGLVEAVMIVGFYPGEIGLAAIGERASAIFFHVGLTSIALGGGSFKKIAWGLPIAMLLHSLLNFFAVFYFKSLGVLWSEVIIGGFALIIWIAANILYGKGKE